MNFNVEIFEGKTFGDLLKDIVKNHKTKQGQIKALIAQLTEMVSEPGDAIAIVPLISNYLESDIKNDEALIKIAQIVQKAAIPTAEAGASGLSDADLEKLFSDITTNTTPLEQTEIKELPNSQPNG
jgi:hypothetical protein